MFRYLLALAILFVSLGLGQIEICKTYSDPFQFMDIYKTSCNRTLLFSYLQKNWADSRAHCASIGAELLKISTSDLNSEIGTYFRKRYWGDSPPEYTWRYIYHWIGAYKDNNTWFWLPDNATVMDNFTSFTANSPKDGSKEACIEILLLNYHEKKILWNDAYCSINRQFICEMKTQQEQEYKENEYEISN